MTRLAASSRHGTILIIVAGISALLASMALTFLVRMRGDIEESQAIVNEAQAHIMKVAACNFIMESARLGWDPKRPNGNRSPMHRESFGWIDVRDGQPGPRGEDGKRLGPVDNNDVPVAGVGGDNKWDRWVDLALTDSERPAKRCPMQVLIRPPFAVSPQVAPNAITITGPNAFKPYAIKPDPQPFQIDIGMSPADFAEAYINGNKQLDQARYVSSWFRVWRAGPASFVVTCGVGDTLGLKDWDEVRTADETGRFGGDTEQGRAMFQFFQQQEVHLWYLVEWSAHVASSDYQNLQNEYSHTEIVHPIPLPNGNERKTNKAVESYLQRPINTSQETRSQGKMVNSVGTIRLIQRLINEPDYW